MNFFDAITMYCGGGNANDADWQQSKEELGSKLPHLWRQLPLLNFGFIFLVLFSFPPGY
jgi:hypothetical protein